MDADRPQCVRRCGRGIAFQDYQVGGLADFQTAAGLIEMALPGGVGGDRPKGLDRRDALIRVQDAAPSFMSRRTAFSTQRSGSIGVTL